MMPIARTAYMDASVQTASPARLLVMLYDRLVLDCRRALAAQQADDHAEAHQHLVHAQDVVAELRGSLKTDVWEGGPALAALYGHLLVQLVDANVKRDPSRTEHCLELAVGLAEAWREAALQTAVVGA
jgi:flagellar secretion chaperone FliS